MRPNGPPKLKLVFKKDKPMPLAQAQHHNSGAPYLSNTSGQYGQNLYTAEQTANANYSTPTYSQHSEMHTSPCHAYADILFYGNISRYLIDPVGILAPIGDSSSSYDEGADDSTHSSTSTSDTRRYCSQIPSRLNVRIEEDGVTFYKHLHSGNEHIQGIQANSAGAMQQPASAAPYSQYYMNHMHKNPPHINDKRYGVDSSLSISDITTTHTNAYCLIHNAALQRILDDILDELLFETVVDMHKKYNTGALDNEAAIPGKNSYKVETFLCDNGCGRAIAANRYAPHLEKCTGLGKKTLSLRRTRARTIYYGESSDDELDNDDDDDDTFSKSKRKRKKTNSASTSVSPNTSAHSFTPVSQTSPLSSTSMHSTPSPSEPASRPRAHPPVGSLVYSSPSEFYLPY